jgi:branched-chain amino acid aminotransferase
MNYVCYNHAYYPVGTPLFTAQNRGFKYGDGLFETMKVYQGKLLLASYHGQRLFSGLALLNIEWKIAMEQLTSMIRELCEKNGCLDSGRIRLAVFREADRNASFLIEAFPLSPSINQWNEQGLIIDLFPYARKSTDVYSNLKTANFLPYVLADLYAKERQIDDSIVLNTDTRICDTSKANLFLIKDGQLYTPSLDQGCVNGVMRRYLIEALKQRNRVVHQKSLSETDLYDAEEIFLTNAIFGMRWVARLRNKTYNQQQSLAIYREIIQNAK